jgi:biotin carboxylase
MKTIVFIASQKSGSSREAIKAAEELGYYTVLFTDRIKFFEKRTEFPDVHLMQLCDLNNIEDIQNAIIHLQSKALKICAIVSFVDPYCHTASLLNDRFCTKTFSTEAIGTMENKILSREALAQSPYCPSFISISKDSGYSKKQIKNYLPIIMKSPNSAGSKDVFKINTYNEFRYQIKKLFAKYPKDAVLLEEFIDGPQYLVETIFYENEVNIIAIIEQEITFNERFIITGYNLMTDIEPDFYNNLKIAVESIVRCHGMTSGPCHLEMRYVNNKWKLIEINPRISGAGMNKFIQIALGINLVKETLKFALGQDFNIQPKYKIPCFSQYVVISETGILQKVTGKNKTSKSLGVKAVYVKPRKGTLLTPPISMGNRYAYVIATGDNEEEAKKNAKQAAAQIHFCLLPSENDPTKVEDTDEITMPEITTQVITTEDVHQQKITNEQLAITKLGIEEFEMNNKSKYLYCPLDYSEDFK